MAYDNSDKRPYMAYPYAEIVRVLEPKYEIKVDAFGVPENLYPDPIETVDVELWANRLYLAAKRMHIMTEVRINEIIDNPYIAMSNLICDMVDVVEHDVILDVMFKNKKETDLCKFFINFVCLTSQELLVMDAMELVNENLEVEYKWRHPFLPVVSLTRPMDEEKITPLLTGVKHDELMKTIIEDKDTPLTRVIMGNKIARKLCTRMIVDHKDRMNVTSAKKLRTWNLYSNDFYYFCSKCRKELCLCKPEEWTCVNNTPCLERGPKMKGWTNDVIICNECVHK